MSKQEFKYILLGMFVFMLIFGSWFIYHQKYETNVIRADEVLIPTDNGIWLNGQWKREIFIIEEPFKNLDIFRAENDNKLFPDLYEDSIPDIKPEVQAYLNKRNAYVKEIEKKFLNTVIFNEWGPESIFLKPFIDLSTINEILPVMSNGKDRIIVIGFDSGRYRNSRMYLLDTNYQLLDHRETFNWWNFVVSVNFLDRIWTQTGSSGTDMTVWIDQLGFENDRIKASHVFTETQSAVNEIFSKYKVVHATTDPCLAVYGRNILIYWLFFIGNVITFLFICVIPPLIRSAHFIFTFCIIVTLLLLFLYHKQIASYFRNLRK